MYANIISLMTSPVWRVTIITAYLPCDIPQDESGKVIAVNLKFKLNFNF